jgi:hypothetical protein
MDRESLLKGLARAQFGIHPGRPFCVTFGCSGGEKKRAGLEGEGSSQTILLARRGRTIRMCSLDARSEGQSGCSP